MNLYIRYHLGTDRLKKTIKVWLKSYKNNINEGDLTPNVTEKYEIGRPPEGAERLHFCLY